MADSHFNLPPATLLAATDMPGQTPVVLATGRAWTEDRAWARRRKVYKAELEKAATARTNLRDRRDDGLVDE